MGALFGLYSDRDREHVSLGLDRTIMVILDRVAVALWRCSWDLALFCCVEQHNEVGVLFSTREMYMT